MILHALSQYYQRLTDDPNQEIAPFGFSRQKISFCAVIEADGSLAAFQPVVSEVVRGKPLPESLVVPGQSKPSGSGINPCLLWDNATYMLGLVPEGRTADWARKRFEAFRQRHQAVEVDIDDPAFSAVCRFLEKWQPDQADAHPELAEVTQNFGAFRLRGQQGYVHSSPAVQHWWAGRMAQEDDSAVLGRCLVSNEQRPIARLHQPKIKGVQGAQTMGALLVSFNDNAYESYGKEQNYNAPVSEEVAFQYTTALNHLLAEPGRRIQIGDATTVFWTDRPCPEEQMIPMCFAGSIPKAEDSDDPELIAKVRTFLQRLRLGKPDDAADALSDPTTTYYILGLSPNASRLSVRFWQAGTLGDLAERLAKHVRDLDIVGLDDHPPILRELLRETAPVRKGWPDEESIPKPLETALVQAVLQGLPYPLALYTALLRRIGAEQFVNPEKRNNWRRAMAVRAAAVKAVLIRNFNKEISMSLDPERPEPAYQLGRWFALLEKIQQDALGSKINATIRDRFYTAASATPAAVFSRLITLSKHHLSGIDREGLRITRERQAQEIAERLNNFPARLALADQGLFHLGYYHQRSEFYRRKEETTDATEPLETAETGKE